MCERSNRLWIPCRLADGGLGKLGIVDGPQPSILKGALAQMCPRLR